MIRKLTKKTQTATFFHYHAQCLLGASEAVTRIRPVMHGRAARGSHVNNWGINGILVQEIHFRNYFNVTFPLNKAPRCFLCRMMSFNQNISYQFLSLPQTLPISFVLTGPHQSPESHITTNYINYSEAELALKQRPSSLVPNIFMATRSRLQCSWICSIFKKLVFAHFMRDSLLFPINYQFPSELQLVIHPPSLLSPLSSKTKINQKLPADNYRGAWSTRIIFSLFQNLNGLQLSIYGSGLNC